MRYKKIKSYNVISHIDITRDFQVGHNDHFFIDFFYELQHFSQKKIKP